jgi:sodium-independent sulfate anion transporter 11
VSVDAGFLVQFVSVPVVAGFTSASAIIIASSQVKGLFGVSYNSEGFVESWIELFRHIGSTRLWDTVLSVSCIIALLGLRVRNSAIFTRMTVVVFDHPQQFQFNSITALYNKR